MFENLNIDQTPLSLNSLLVNLAVGLIVSILIKTHYSMVQQLQIEKNLAIYFPL